MGSHAGSSDRIQLDNSQNLALWAQKLDATSTQIRDAVDAVGDDPSDVEMYLKGSRSTTNSERMAEKKKPN